MDAAVVSRVRAAGVLLIAGWLIFWSGAPAWRHWTGSAPPKFLEQVAANIGEWYWSAGAFAVGVLLTLFGFLLLGNALRSSGDRVWSELGLTAFFFGALLWIASLTFRVTATVAAANETVASGQTPIWYSGIAQWSGGLFSVYMVLAYLAIAAYGKALHGTIFAPSWMSWTAMVFGLAGSVGFIARFGPFGLPLTIHLVPGILGIVLLVRSRRSQISSVAAIHAPPLAAHQ